MAAINTYLTFNGNCEDVFIFYKSVFGGEFTKFTNLIICLLKKKCHYSEEKKPNYAREFYYMELLY